MKTLIDRLVYWTRRNPDKAAIIFNDQIITYKNFLEQITHLSEQFSYTGWTGKHIAVMLPNSSDVAIIYYAAFRAGVILIPINIAWKADQIKQIITNTTPLAAIVDASVLTEFSQIAIVPKESCYIIGEKIIGYPSFADFRANTPQAPIKKFKQTQPAMIFATSGSTGNPKAIVHSFQSLLAMADNMADCCDLTAKDKFLISESMSNASGTTHLTLTLSHGGTTILAQELSIDPLKTILQKDKPTIICVMGKGNLDIIDAKDLSKKNFQSVRINFTGGDKITKELINQFQQKTDVAMRVGYGMSECLAITINRSRATNKQGSVGKPTKNLQLKICDKNGKKVKSRKIGEIWVKGKNIMLEYWNNPEATAQALVKGWLRTGDLAYQDKDGYVWIVGRLKNIIIRDGENVSPYEIEEALAMHPAVKIAGVIGVADKKEGQVPYAFVELKKPCTVKDLKTYLEKKLDYLFIPKVINIVDSLPRTSTGKIDREKLRKFIK